MGCKVLNSSLVGFRLRTSATVRLLRFDREVRAGNDDLNDWSGLENSLF